MKKRKVFASITLIFLVILIGGYIWASKKVNTLANDFLRDNLSEIIHRKVVFDTLDINLIQGSIALEDFQIFEPDDSVVFVSNESVEVNVNLLKSLYQQQLCIEDITLFKPEFFVEYIDTIFNVSQFINGITIEKDTTDTTASALLIEILNIHILDGKLIFYDRPYELRTSLDSIDVYVPEWTTENGMHALNASGRLNNGGTAAIDLRGDGTVFTIGVDLDTIPVDLLGPYAREFMEYQSLEGNITANLQMSGLRETMSLTAMSGELDVDKFALRDLWGERVASFSQFSMDIDTIDIKNDEMHVQNITLDSAFVRYQQYESTDNVSLMFTLAKAEGEVENGHDVNPIIWLGELVRDLALEYVQSDYLADTLAFTNNKVLLEFYNYQDQMFMEVDDLNLFSTSAVDTLGRIHFDVSSTLNNYSNVDANIYMYPGFSKKVDIDVRIDSQPLAMLSPITAYFLDRELYDGLISLDNELRIRKDSIYNNCLVTIDNLEAGKSMKYETASDLNLQAVHNRLKNKNGISKINVVIEGNIDNPDFDLNKLILESLSGAFTRALGTPLRVIDRINPLKYGSGDVIYFDCNTYDLSRPQVSVINAKTNLLKVKARTTIHVNPMQNIDFEKRRLAAEELKVKYFIETRNLKPFRVKKAQRGVISKIPPNDPDLLHWMNARIPFEEHHRPIWQKAELILGKAYCDKVWEEKSQLRMENIRTQISKKASKDIVEFDPIIDDNRVLRPQFNLVIDK